MILKLVVTTNVNGDVFELVLKNARYGVGRRHDNDLRIKETYISGYHAELVRGEDGEFLLADLGSSNGTFLNGRRISTKEAIKAGDFIKFGILKVAVEEQTDATPKIVALKDRPAFSRKDASQTSAIAVERKTGSIGTVEPGSPPGGTRPTPVDPPSSKPTASEGPGIAELQSRLLKESGVVVELKQELETAKKRSEALSKEAAKAREAGAAQLAEAEQASRCTNEELASGLAVTEAVAAKLAAERDSLKVDLETKTDELASREEVVANLVAERDSLKATVDAKEGDLVASVGEIAKLATVTASLAALQQQFAATRAEAEAERAHCNRLEETMREKDTEIAAQAKGIGSLRTEIAALVSASEAERTGLAERLEASQARIEQSQAEVVKIRAELDTERTALAESQKEIERENAKLGKGLATLEAKQVKQIEELSIAKSALADREKELRACAVEARRTEKATGEAEVRIQFLEAALLDAKAKGIDLAKTLEDRAEAVAESRSEIDRISAELDRLRRESSEQIAAKEAAFADEASGLRVQIEERDSDLAAASLLLSEVRIELGKSIESSSLALIDLEMTWRARAAELETELVGERVRSADGLAESNRLEESLGALQVELGTLREESAQLRLQHEDATRSNGRLQAQLDREAAERNQMSEVLEANRARATDLVSEVEVLQLALEGKEREIAEREQHYTRTEGEIVQKLKREMSDVIFVRDAAEERASKALKEKQTLAGAFERLKEQLVQTETSLREAKVAEEALNHGKGLLARRVEKAEASNNELAVRLKEEAMSALANRALIEKLERQIQEDESEAVKREREQVHTLQADLSRASRRSAEDERRRRDIEAELARAVEARRQGEERLLALETRLVEQETENISTRGLLGETEKTRVDLASRLAGEAALVVSHVRTIEGLRQELADTISRFTASETSLIASHSDETDELLTELRGERTRREGFEVELKHTREGLSEALHRAREDSVKLEAKLLAEGHAKLSSVEEELSAVIRSRETVEESRSALEDELNRRDEEIEDLSQQIEDLEIRLRDESEERQGILKTLETTRAGFSETLRSGWNHLGMVRSALEEEKSVRKEAESGLSRAKEDVERLHADITQWERRHLVEIREWEERYETLRSEKLTLATEDGDLGRIREEILAASVRKRTLEEEMEGLGAALKDFQTRQIELGKQRETLLAEREELKAALNGARTELGILQKRCTDSKDEEIKQMESIAAAERRIQSLRKLEAEMELAVERRRQQHVLNRGDVFSEVVDLPLGESDFSQEDFYRKLIAKLDLIDDLAKRYDNKWLYPKVSEQLAILKRGFIDFLQDHSVKQFDLEPGTVLSLAERKRIKLVPLQNGAARKSNGNGSAPHSSKVVETLRPGYVYQNGSKDVIIRKAEVLVS